MLASSPKVQGPRPFPKSRLLEKGISRNLFPKDHKPLAGTPKTTYIPPLVLWSYVSEFLPFRSEERAAPGRLRRAARAGAGSAHLAVEMDFSAPGEDEAAF